MKDYLCKKLFNRLSGTLVIRARCGNNITGLACCNILYPSPRYSGQLHIKELYVSQCDRNKGTGKAIMRFIARLALEQECLSLSWNAEKSNPGANRFYQALGGRINDHIVNYYLHGESLSKLKRFHRSGVNTTTISGSFYTYIRKMWRVTVKTWPISLKGLLRICFSSQPIPG